MNFCKVVHSSLSWLVALKLNTVYCSQLYFMWLQKTFHCPWINSTELMVNSLAVVIFYCFMLELIKFNIMPRVWLQCALHFLPTWFLKETFCECKWNELRQNCTTVKPGCQSVLSQSTVLCFVHFCLVPYIALLQCILSIFPVRVHLFYANILVFVNINPFLYINDQFALTNIRFTLCIM